MTARLARLVRGAMLVLGTGYVLCFFSETLFWSFWRADEGGDGRLLQWLLYAAFGYLTLAVIWHFRVTGLWSLVLAGAFFGWLGEGVVAMTVYGDPSMPFPLTIAWTALAWHGPISVVLGWYVLGLALREPRAGPATLLALGLGLLWGVWGFGWMAETPPVGTDPADFLLHALATTGCLALAHLAIAAGRPADYAPSRLGLIVVGAAALAFFALVTVPAVPFAPLVLLPLFGLLLLPLRRVQAGWVGAGVLVELGAPVRVRNLAALALMPLVAAAVYAVASASLPPLPAIHLLLAVATSLLGTVLFAIAFTRAVRRRARDPEL